MVSKSWKLISYKRCIILGGNFVKTLRTSQAAYYIPKLLPVIYLNNKIILRVASGVTPFRLFGILQVFTDYRNIWVVYLEPG